MGVEKAADQTLEMCGGPEISERPGSVICSHRERGQFNCGVAPFLLGFPPFGKQRFGRVLSSQPATYRLQPGEALPLGAFSAFAQKEAGLFTAGGRLLIRMVAMTKQAIARKGLAMDGPVPGPSETYGLA